VKQNLALAFPENPSLQKQLEKTSYHQFGNLVLEILLVLSGMKSFILRYSQLIGLNHIQEAQRLGKGFIFLSSHLGNWEIMAATGAILGKSNLMLVTKKIKPEWLHRAIEKSRNCYEVRATYEPRTLRDVLSHLKKNGAVGFVLDQYAGAPVGVRVPFFNTHVGTSTVIATLAKRTGVPVLPVKNYRKSDGSWVVHIHAPLQWKDHPDAHYELALNTAEYTKTLEKFIRSHPEQWLWTHRRFKGDLSPLHPNEWNEPRSRK
jgi:KDO2-lipid IV(A) lauroyltransferase